MNISRVLGLSLVGILHCGGAGSPPETTPAKIDPVVAPAMTASATLPRDPVPTPTLQSIHAHDGSGPVVELAIHTNDEKGIPVLWGESLLARLHHKGFAAKGRQVHFRGYDEIDGMIEIARVAKRSPLRFGEVRLIAEESTTDARIRILVRELECKDWKTRVLIPMGRVGTDEASMMRLSEAVEAAVTESLVQGFNRGFCE
ncbi:MAG: hypothetical protein KBF88_03860 [Polyangiaceae bacterium]|nr:hypothetical protein [Polyangiaceae bacterium]